MMQKNVGAREGYVPLDSPGLAQGLMWRATKHMWHRTARACAMCAIPVNKIAWTGVGGQYKRFKINGADYLVS
jgi:hypothetical protein